MIARNFAALALFAMLGSALADPAKVFTRRFSPLLDKRQSGQGYTPDSFTCGYGNTCAEACGAGYITCLETDTTLACYNPGAGETCCSDGTGNSCKAGYFCALDAGHDTFCCASGSTLEQCAILNSASGLSSVPTLAPSSAAASSLILTTSTSTSVSTSFTSTKTSTATRSVSSLSFSSSTSLFGGAALSSVTGQATQTAATATATATAATGAGDTFRGDSTLSAVVIGIIGIFVLA